MASVTTWLKPGANEIGLPTRRQNLQPTCPADWLLNLSYVRSLRD
ncbi:MAG: hypothetical protein QOH70_1746 [Blastocatellia bacterium]|jgi:hypothetical protein|nr:hypothetical protein [Blastocatellia bacterium]